MLVTRRVRCPRRNRIRIRSEAEITISALTPLPRGAQGLPLHQNLHHEALSTAAAAAIAPAVAGASATADPFVLPDEVLAAMQLPERAAPAANAHSFVTARLLRRRVPDLGCAAPSYIACLASPARRSLGAVETSCTQPPLQCQGLYLECM